MSGATIFLSTTTSPSAVSRCNITKYRIAWVVPVGVKLAATGSTVVVVTTSVLCMSPLEGGSP